MAKFAADDTSVALSTKGYFESLCSSRNSGNKSLELVTGYSAIKNLLKYVYARFAYKPAVPVSGP
jgi:hypothetical protein